MRKILLTIAATMASLASFAQYNSGGFSLDKDNMYYGIRIGMTVSRLHGDAHFFTPDDSKTGLTLGGVLGLRLSNFTPVFLESGLYYTERGGKGNDINPESAKKHAVSKFNIIEIPVLIKYGIKTGDEVALLPFAGSYFSMAVNGKTNKHGTFQKDYFKRFDAGFKLGCGVEYSLLYIEMGYQFGLSNISNNEDNSVHHGALFANFGVNF